MKRDYIEIVKAILLCLNDNKLHSYGDIERKANTNWESVRNHIKLLEVCEAVTINKENKIRITPFGFKIISKL